MPVWRGLFLRGIFEDTEPTCLVPSDMTPEEKQQHYRIAETLLAEQNFAGAVLFGAIATILSAWVYGLFGATGATIGFVAMGIGFVVGFTVQYVGRGIDTRFTLLASAYAVIGCLGGNLFALVGRAARASGVSSFELLRSMPPGELVNRTIADLQFVDLVFWLLAIWAAAYWANRPLTREQRLSVGLYTRRARG